MNFENFEDLLNLKLLTKSQTKAAVKAKTPIVVAASAGSGKTSVLATRVVLKLLNEKAKTTPENILVLTFAKSAADEMFNRIYSKMKAIAQKFPKNKKIREQLLLLSKKNITTIDSFCYNILLENFEIGNISPNFQIGDETFLAEIKNKILDNILENEYCKNSNKFNCFCKYFSLTSDDGLKKAIIELYSKAKSQPFPIQYIKSLINNYNFSKQLNETDFSYEVKNGIYDRLKNAQFLLYSCKSQMDDIILRQNFEPVVNDIIYNIENALKKIENSNFSEIFNILKEIEFKSMPRYSAKSNPFDRDLAEELKTNFLNPAKKTISALFDHLVTEKEFFSDIAKQKPIVEKLINLTINFLEEFEKEKKNLNILEFSDLLTKTLKLIVKPTIFENELNLTSFGKEFASNFKEILVDEFQDINPAQNMLLRAISDNGNNLFIVGDLKQSIYRFRKASPEIFANYRHKFKTMPYKKTLIVLNNNFRSKKEVTGSVNFLFGQLMSKDFGKIDYKDGEQLISSKKFKSDEDSETELHILKNDTNLFNTEFESIHVANIVKQMIDKKFQVNENGNLRPCKPCDFAIILRSEKNIVHYICEQLSNLNIPFSSQSNDTFINSYEISIVISILKLVDNPLLDISLCAVAMSDIFNFSEDELAKIKLCEKNKPLYFAFMKSENPKCKNFIEFIKKLRKIASSSKITNLIEKIYDKILHRIIDDNLKNKDRTFKNLKILLQIASEHEALSSNGLTEFLQTIKNLQKNNLEKNSNSSVSISKTAVNIITIHKSKGLEFPIVIVPFTAKQFNEQDFNKPMLISSKFGLTLKHSNSKTLSRYNTLMFTAAMFAEKNLMKEEELRLLYVAMTRAKEKLILTALDNKQQFKIPINDGSIVLNSSFCRNKKSFYDWILAGFLRHKNSYFLNKKIDFKLDEFKCNLKIKTKFENVKTKEKICQQEDNIIEHKIMKKLKDMIENSHKTNNIDITIPAKISVSELSKQGNVKTTLKYPNFSNKKTASEVGIATHNFLQYANFKSAKGNIEKEIETLVKKEFITSRQATILNKNQLKKFLNSKTYKLITLADKLEREKNIIFKIKAKEIYENAPFNTEIVIQGVIDCIIEKNNEITIIDYKTDEIAEGNFAKLYKKQLLYYKKAIETLEKKPVKNCIIFSLFHGKSFNFKF